MSSGSIEHVQEEVLRADDVCVGGLDQGRGQIHDDEVVVLVSIADVT